jgi:hypothetical protein
MSADGMDLAALQREMAAAVMRPLTADEQMQERAPDGRPMAAVAETFIAPNSRLTAFERLEIYNRQYWFRVLSALAEDFPGLRAILGSLRYDALAIAYLTAHPSRSFTLRNLGAKLAGFLEANPRYAGRRRRLAVDVARIEWAFVEAFDSAERAPLTLEQISTLDANSRLALQPHLRLLALEFPADELVLSLHQRDKRQTSEAGVEHEDSEIPPARLPRFRKHATWVAAHRLQFSVYYKRLCREEFLTLSAIRAGSSLVQAIAAGFEDSEIPESSRAGHVQQWFADWAELGWLCAPELDESIAV